MGGEWYIVRFANARKWSLTSCGHQIELIPISYLLSELGSSYSLFFILKSVSKKRWSVFMLVRFMYVVLVMLFSYIMHYLVGIFRV